MPPENEQPTPTQTETPSPESSSPPSERTEIAFEEPDFSEIAGFAEDEGDGDEPIVPDVKAEETKKETPEETPPETPETPPAPEEPTSKEPATDVKPQPTEEPKPETPSEPSSPPEVKMPTREELEGMYTQHREATLPNLEKLYALTQEEAEAFNESPEKVLPKLAARLHYDSMMSSYNAVMAALPAVVNRVVEATRVANEAENAFFKEWPELAAPEHKAAVQAAVRAFRTSKPTAKLEEVIRGAGTLAMVNLGIERKAPATQQQQQPPRPTPPRPVAPAGASPVPPTPPKQEEENIFSELGGLFRDEMMGT